MASDKETKPYKPSSYELVRLDLIPSGKGKALPLQDVFTELEIKEGIGRKTMRGHIKFLDSADIMNKMEFTGLEMIEASWKSTAVEDPEVEFKMQVFRTSFSPSDDGTKKLVQLDLCSPEHYLSVINTIDGCYAETSPSDDVKTIFDNTLGKGKKSKSLETHETNNAHTKIIPGMTVLEAMEYLTRVSQSATFKSSLYRFYETRDGFYFHNVEQMINERRGNPIEFTLIPNASECPQDEAAQTVITNINFNQQKDMMTMLKSGNLSNEVKQISILDKTVNRYQWSLQDTWEDTEHLDDSAISIHTKDFHDEYIDDVDVARTFTVYDHTDFNDGAPMQDETYMSRRLGYLLSLQQMSATMGVHGNTKLKIGDCVELTIPATTPFEGREEEPFVGGVWCITGLTHRVDDKNYAIEVTIIKDSYTDTAPEGNKHKRLSAKRKASKQEVK